LAGIELGRQTQTNTQFNGTAMPVAAIDPVLTRPEYSLAPAAMNLFTGYVLGTYLQDQIAWKRFRILAGARRDLFDQAQDSRLPGIARLSRADQEWSPRVGVVYRLTNSSSVYTSYSKTFDPSGEALSLAANTAELAPEQTRNYEAGAKANLLGNRFTASAAIFRLIQNNIRTVDPLNPSQLILVGEQRTQGVELNLSGRIWRALNLTGGYALYDPRILRSNSLSNGVPIEGKIPGLVPRRSGNLWATYFWSNGFGIGAGAYQSSARFAANDNLAMLPGYVRLDAALFYGRGKWRASINIRNLLDRGYYEAAQSDSQIMPGAPVNGLATIAYRW
ncbi:MAG: TonB-dependent receptor, partial [Bryobacteraceae bacterium]